MQNRAPLIVAIVLLSIPVLYVGSYLALVTPDGGGGGNDVQGLWFYRLNTHSWAGKVFWPLEQLDRKIRPKAWLPDPFA